MYDQFYHFNAEPFRLSPDHAFAYAHQGYTKARAYMAYAFMRAEGFVMITGRPGTGKTTLIGALLDQLAGENVRTANLVCTQVQADDLLKLVAYEFGIATTVVEKGELLQRLTQQFKSWHRDGQRALLIVDEAQDLSVSAVEELRLLTNIQVEGRPLLQIFLLGQPELRELVLSPQLEQMHQRIVAASHLRPLESQETEAYIVHRLEAVGWCGDPSISQAVFPLIFKFSEGIPRRINLICSRLLLHCAVEQRHRVEVADMRAVVGELQDENLAAGPRLTERDFQVEDVFPPAPASDTDANDGAAPADGAQPVAQAEAPAAADRPVSTPSTTPAADASERAPAADPAAPGVDAPDDGAPVARQEPAPAMDAEVAAGRQVVAKAPPAGEEAGITESDHEEDKAPIAALSGSHGHSRQRLQIVAGAAAPLRTGTDGDGAARQGFDGGRTPLLRQARATATPARRRAAPNSAAARDGHERRDRAHTVPPVAGEANVGSGPESQAPTTAGHDGDGPGEHTPARSHRAARRGSGHDTGGFWPVALMLGLSVALVVWAATGFDLGLFFD